MSPDNPLPPDRAGSWSLSDASSRAALQLIAEGVTELAGFGVAGIGVVLEDELEMVAVAGSDEARRELIGTRTPLALIQAELDQGDDWGPLRFIPHGRLGPEAGTRGWIPDVEPGDWPDAWHPLDALRAPLYDAAGALRGLLSIDLPVDGRRPGEAQRRVLEKYAEQAGRAVLTALEREDLAEQVRLATAARTIVRNASGQLSIGPLLEECREALVEGFRTLGMWIQTYGEDGYGTGSIHAIDGTEVALPSELMEMAEWAARIAWTEQRVDVLRQGQVLGPAVTPEQGEQIRSFLEGIGVGSVLFVPLGAGPECLGNLVLTRAEGDDDWSEVETAAALDVGHDLGRAIANARTFERERQLVKELQALDAYKNNLIATVSHELKSPLSTILGHLEMLDSAPELSDLTKTSLAAMDRGARRLGRVVDDLLLLARVGDPNQPLVPAPVDLRQIVGDVLELTGVDADRRRLTVRLEAPPEPVVAWGDADELDRVLTNLVSNAVKYTPEGGTITVSLSRAGCEVQLSVADEGIGISAHDQMQLFTEFFRSNNPVALAQPGTGLGLAIVARIVARHRGRIEVASELGVGSTFRVFIPAASEGS